MTIEVSNPVLFVNIFTFQAKRWEALIKTLGVIICRCTYVMGFGERSLKPAL